MQNQYRGPSLLSRVGIWRWNAASETPGALSSHLNKLGITDLMVSVSFVDTEPLGRKGLGAGSRSPAPGGWTKAAFQPGFAELRSDFSSWKHACQTPLESPEASADPRGTLTEGCDLPHGSPHSGLNASTLQQLQTPLLLESYRYRNREEQCGPGTTVSSPLSPVCPVSSFLMHRYSLYSGYLL